MQGNVHAISGTASPLRLHHDQPIPTKAWHTAQLQIIPNMYMGSNAGGIDPEEYQRARHACVEAMSDEMTQGQIRLLLRGEAQLVRRVNRLGGKKPEVFQLMKAAAQRYKMSTGSSG